MNCGERLKNNLKIGLRKPLIFYTVSTCSDLCISFLTMPISKQHLGFILYLLSPPQYY